MSTPPVGVARLVGERGDEIEARILERLQRWVERESPSGDAGAVGMLAAEIAEALRHAGGEVDQFEAPGWGVHLRAILPGLEPDLEPILILGHLDTVYPIGTLVSQPFRIKGDRAEGPGVYDMKAGLAVAVEVLSLLAKTGTGPRRPVHVLITCDEETGSATSRALIEESAGGARAVLVLEPPLPDGGAKTSRKGIANYRIRAIGKAAHAGVEPERGVSATIELAHQIVQMSAMADPVRGSTISVGLIGGGTASNVVPAEAWAELDVRFLTESEGKRLDVSLRSLRPVLPGASLILEGGVNRPPLERSEGVVQLYRHARDIASEMGWQLAEGTSGGGSDGSFTAAIGIPTLDGLGVLGGGAHSTDEFIQVTDIRRRVALLGRLLETL